ncbi:glycosyltransferase [Arthrobacter sp. ATA002]|uniref:glycosyltransferase n=1 Tax=Arthrobacter sp. ATA002 TaxID=2991715 RepID=UPI0022A6F2D1|nr:glycosyltransferase [Arthrobacter sp. ATA002]WAP52909.1 glycosyltransferase [Arthrobacter sp. ATA002]
MALTQIQQVQTDRINVKFEDEFRPASAVAGAKRARVAADLDGFIVKYDGLFHRDRRNTATIEQLQKQVKDLQGKVSQLNRVATQRNAELRRVQSEKAKLQVQLAALRNSWRVRIGAAATAPFRWAGTASRRLSLGEAVASQGSVSSGEITEGGTATKAVPRLSTELVSKRVSGTAESGTSHVESRNQHDEWKHLLDLVDSFPTKANVLKAASFGYYTLGRVTLPLRLLTDHHELLTPLTSKENLLVKTLEGLASVRESEFSIPPRQSNPGYQAERGRLLYCAHSVAPYNSNGYSTRTSGLIEGMVSTGLDIVVAARPGYPWDVKTDVAPDAPLSFEKTINGVTHFFSSGPSWTGDRLDYYLQQSADSYVQVAMRTRAETIQAASNHVTALPALIAARRLGLPFIYEVRGLWEVTKASISPQWAGSEAFELAKKLETIVATSADLVCAITEQVKEELVARGVSPDKIVILHNGVNTTQFTPMPAHAPTQHKLGLDAATPVIGYAGSLVEYEGLESLLEASRALADRGVNFRTVIVGDGASLPRLLQMTADLDIADHVTFTGRVSPAEVADYISTFDVLPCPRLPLDVTEMVSP